MHAMSNIASAASLSYREIRFILRGSVYSNHVMLPCSVNGKNRDDIEEIGL